MSRVVITFAIIVAIAAFSGANRAPEPTLVDRIATLEHELTQTKNDLSRFKQAMAEVKTNANAAKKFADSFTLSRVDYDRSMMGNLEATFFHQVWHNRNHEDVNGKKHKLILPGLDATPNRIGCWVLDWEK